MKTAEGDRYLEWLHAFRAREAKRCKRERVSMAEYLRQVHRSIKPLQDQLAPRLSRAA